jgi:hypothetical protein
MEAEAVSTDGNIRQRRRISLWLILFANPGQHRSINKWRKHMAKDAIKALALELSYASNEAVMESAARR